MILILFTASYPYEGGGEQTFLSGELQHLAGSFERIVLVPGNCRDNRMPVPDGMEVDESLARALEAGRLPFTFGAIRSPAFYEDILSRPSILLHQALWKRLLNFVGKAVITRSWVRNWIARSGVPLSDCIFYTYWFDHAAYGIGLTKKQWPGIRLVSRAHGYDLYEERHPFSYWPCRRKALASLDRLFVASNDGLQYISERYPEGKPKYAVSLLGVEPAGFVSARSMDGIFRIVSCSSIVPVKRVELILDGIASAAQRLPEVRFEWHHFGDGEALTALRERARATFSSNASGFLHGQVSPKSLFEFYESNPVDVFINASRSEGTPVAIMEAMSCSMPVIATAVGGNKEIVSPENGLLLPANPTADEVAGAILQMQSDPEAAARKGERSYFTWRDRYNADTNYSRFAATLRQVAHTEPE